MKAWLTPAEAATGFDCITVRVPSNPAAYAALLGAAFLLSDPTNWEQIDDETITPGEAAAQFEETVRSIIELAPCRTYIGRVLATQTSSILGYWPLNDSEGMVAQDVSTNGLDGSVSGVTWGETGIDSAVSGAGFDGINDAANFYTAGLASLAYGASALTFAGWFRIDGIGAQRILLSANTAGNPIAWYVATSQDRLEMVYTDSSSHQYSIPISAPVDYVHLATVITTSQVQHFINGAKVHESGIASLTHDLQRIEISRTFGHFYGAANHISLWGCALTPEEIAALSVV